SRAERSPEGRVFRSGLMVDVTALKEAEAALAESERRFRSVVNSVPGAVFTQRQRSDGTLAFTFFSDGVQALFGITPAEAVADDGKVEALFHPDERELRQRSRVESVERLSLRDLDLRFRHPDGTYHWLHVRAIPHKEPGGEVVWDGICYDVTDRR